jgi:hypothetical protein
VSAPALHPTARLRPVLLERLERLRGAHCLAALLLVVFVVWLRVDSAEVTWSAAVICALLGGFLMAAQHEDQPVWDAALPVDPAGYARVRLVCGVAGSAFLLALAAGLYAALFADQEHPRWYPLALFAWGLTSYLLTSAAHQGTGALVYPMLCLLPVPLLLACFEEPVELGRMGATAVLARTALLLGLAGATAYVAACFPARAPQVAAPAARLPRATWRNPVRALPARPAAPAEHPARPLVVPAERPAQGGGHGPAAAGHARLPGRVQRRAGPARPSATVAVFRRHFALLRRVAVLPVATLLFVTVLVLMHLVAGPGEAGEDRTVRYFVESAGLREACVWLALSWAVLVWLGERGARRQWNDTLPVATAKRRMVHAGAGAAWLLLFLAVVVTVALAGAAAAGTLASPARIPAWLWLELPTRALTLYLAATLILFGARPTWEFSSSLVPYMVVKMPDRLIMPMGLITTGIGVVAIPLWLLRRAMDLLTHLALSLAGDAGPGGWSYGAAVLWLVLYAAAAWVAIALEDWIHQSGRLPTVREMRDLVRGWAGTRPVLRFADVPDREKRSGGGMIP